MNAACPSGYALHEILDGIQLLVRSFEPRLAQSANATIFVVLLLFLLRI